MTKQIVILGFHVMAGVEGSKNAQAISKRYSSKPAADAFCELAKKTGFKDAYVVSVEGFEPDLEAKRKKRETRPKQIA